MVIRTFRELSFQVPRYSVGVFDEGSLAISINPLRLAFPGLPSEPVSWSGSSKVSVCLYLTTTYLVASHIHLSLPEVHEKGFSGCSVQAGHSS